MTSPYKAVCFDVGGVLTHSMSTVMPQAAIAAGIDLEKLGPIFMEMFISEGDTDNPGHQLERGEISMDHFVSIMGDMGTEIRKVLHPASEHFIMAKLEPAQVMHDFVQEVRNANFATGIISNVISEWLPWWENFTPTHELFDVVLYSCDVGLRKPNASIYLSAAQQLNFTPEEIVYLDDFLPMAEAARKVGMKVIHVTDHATAIAEARELLGL
jgi:putative hydrolase of the HAD superfamily